MAMSIRKQPRRARWRALVMSACVVVLVSAVVVPAVAAQETPPTTAPTVAPTSLPGGSATAPPDAVPPDALPADAVPVDPNAPTATTQPDPLEGSAEGLSSGAYGGQAPFDLSSMAVLGTELNAIRRSSPDVDPADIAGFTLTANIDYIVAASGLYGSIRDLYAGSISILDHSASPGITFEGSRGAAEGPGLNYPTGFREPLSPTTFGANFQFTTIPEPSTWILLVLGGGLLAKSCLRSRPQDPQSGR